MRYILQCLLKGKVEDYYHQLVDDIAYKFDLKVIKLENWFPHFTLKYWFETDDISKVEEVIEEFVNQNKKSKIRLGGFDNFENRVVFIKVKPSKEARETFKKFIQELKKIQWMPWRTTEGENLIFHTTIADECEEKLNQVMDYLRGKERYFDCSFDNITILREVSRVNDISKCEIYKSFLMN